MTRRARRRSLSTAVLDSLANVVRRSRRIGGRVEPGETLEGSADQPITKPGGWTRRRALSRLPWLALLPWALGSATRWRPAPAGEPAAEVSFLREVEAARRVGKAYLRAHPEEAKSVHHDLALRDFESFSRARERDFRDGRTVILDGWLLSRAECRLCALVALGAPLQS